MCGLPGLHPRPLSLSLPTTPATHSLAPVFNPALHPCTKWTQLVIAVGHHAQVSARASRMRFPNNNAMSLVAPPDSNAASRPTRGRGTCTQSPSLRAAGGFTASGCFPRCRCWCQGQGPSTPPSPRRPRWLQGPRSPCVRVQAPPRGHPWSTTRGGAGGQTSAPGPQGQAGHGAIAGQGRGVGAACWLSPRWGCSTH